MSFGVRLIVLGVVGCGGARSGAPVSLSSEDKRQALCPRALDAANLLDGFRHEIAAGCPLPAFVSSDPVCGRSGQCPRPCASTLFLGESEMPVVSYQYDDNGNMIAMSGGRMAVTCAFRNTMVVQCTDNSDGTVKVKRDAAGRIVSAFDDTQSYRFTYNGHGDLATVARPGIYLEDPPQTWTLAYDQRRLATETETASGVRVSYRYDDRGRMIERNEEGGRSPYRETFRYDEADLLIGSSSTRQVETTFKYVAGRIVEYSATSPDNAVASGARFGYECR